MNRKAQAMIIDALFFLMLCGMSAAILAWASSVYGNQALEAYRYLYMIDIESSTVQVLGEISYDYQGNELFWLDQFGRYLEGQFNESDPRFALLLDNWDAVCKMVGNPLMVEVIPEDKTSVCVKQKGKEICADREHPIILSCRLEREENGQVKVTSTLESILNYMTCEGNPGVYEDLGARTGKDYGHMLFMKIRDLEEQDGKCGKDGIGIRPEPPYYASPKFTKLCHNNICTFYAKIYY